VLLLNDCIISIAILMTVLEMLVTEHELERLPMLIECFDKELHLIEVQGE